MNLRDINLEFKGNTKLSVSSCVRNMKPFSSLKILYPTAFHFKEERVLAAHPPSCHPRGGGGGLCLASEKGRENERKWRKKKRSGNC